MRVGACMCVHVNPNCGCSSLHCSNIRPYRHLGPVAWVLGGGSRLATGPDYFLHSPELNSVYAINRCTHCDPNPTVPVTLHTKGCLQKSTCTYSRTQALHRTLQPHSRRTGPQATAASSVVSKVSASERDVMVKG